MLVAEGERLENEQHMVMTNKLSHDYLKQLGRQAKNKKSKLSMLGFKG